MSDFLLEIGTEEIPDWIIPDALADLKSNFGIAFKSLGYTRLRAEATPRRLVLMAQDISEQEPDTQQVIQGPYLSAGAKAAEGFARKNNTAVHALAMMQDAKGERYVFHQHITGQSAVVALQQKLPEIITAIQFPKSMYWTRRSGVRFIRPIRWIVALLGHEIIPFEIAGVHASNTTRGHRILGSKVAVTCETYERLLRENFVILRAEERRERITAALGEDVQPDDELVKTLTYLTEFPSVIRGSFDESYLQLPREILSTVMRHHQRYFSVLRPDGSLAPQFVAVTNTDGDAAGLIQQGNERVLRARFNDARFFWEVDQRRKLSERLPDLAKVTFQAKLGSYLDKTERVVKLGSEIAALTGADAATVERAGELCKCDLTTDMVKEFTELQGIVGGLYAKAQGEGEAVGQAIYDHYKPTSMEDTIPGTLEGQVVSIADKLDTLRECFKIGLTPTGSKDPFALRRAAQGIVKILFAAHLSVPLNDLVSEIPGLAAFFQERLSFYLRDVWQFEYDEVNAVLAAPMTSVADLADRAKALRMVRPTEDFEPLAASFKRIKNILKQCGLSASEHPKPVERDLLRKGPEEDLYERFLGVRGKIDGVADYQRKLSAIATLRPEVDAFFDRILVNDPDPAIRQNRLALLHGLLTAFSSIADFSEIVTEGAGSRMTNNFNPE